MDEKAAMALADRLALDPKNAKTSVGLAVDGKTFVVNVTTGAGAERVIGGGGQRTT
jgi:hypothetical protein